MHPRRLLPTVHRYSLSLSIGAALSSRRRAWAAGTILVALVLGLWAILVLPELGREAELVVGRPSPGDIVAPRAATFASRIGTEEARAAAERAVAPVFGPRDRVATERHLAHVGELLRYVRAVLANEYASAESARADLLAVPELARLPSRHVDQLVGLAPADLDRVLGEVGRIVPLKMRSTVTSAELPVAPVELMDAVDASMDASLADLVAQMAAGLVAANSTVDDSLTASAREAARDAVPDQFVQFAAGQMIVRAGDPIEPEHLEVLAHLGLLERSLDWRNVLGLLAMLAALVVVPAGALLRLQPRVWLRTRPLALGALLLLGFAAAARLLTPGHELLSYALPAASVAMILGVVLGLEGGLAAGVILAVFVGMAQASPDLEMATYVLLGGAAGAVVLGRVERLSAVLLAALAVAVTDIAVIGGFRLGDAPLDIRGASELAAVAIAHGALSGGLTALAVLAAGPLFGVTTSVQLLELGRPNHPLLRRLQFRAPGTYQHSILLGNLAEAAAAAIGADALVVRVGALYHDIGKTVRPQFFIENQLPGQNPHDMLDPVSSARVVVAHISDGEELARRHGLPQGVIDAILEHHGTMRTEYFYRRAVETAAAGSAVDDAPFRYPGPRPRSRETALLMLADGAEAAVRAASPRTSDEMREALDHVFDGRLASGQLDESDLTLRDLERVRDVFVNVLQSVYHPRIRYPEGIGPRMDAGTTAPALASGDAAPALASGKAVSDVSAGNAAHGADASDPASAT